MYYTVNGIICHHGILGMRWGRRNGPPYPLDSGDHSASEKKSGWRKSLSDSISESSSNRQKRKEEKEKEKAIKREEEKKKAIASGDRGKLKKYRNELTPKEAKEAANNLRSRNELDTQLYAPSQLERKINSICRAIDTGNKVVKVSSILLESVLKTVDKI